MDRFRIDRRTIAFIAAAAAAAVAIVLLFPEARKAVEIAAADPVGVKAVSYPNPVMQKQFKDALLKAGVPHKVKTQNGKEYVQWRPEDSPAVEEIEGRVKGAALPSGRNASFADPAFQARFKDWLTQKGVPFEVVSARGSEYVVWDEGRGDLVQEFSRQLAEPCPRRKRSC
jgi:hypothetical protein